MQHIDFIRPGPFLWRGWSLLLLGVVALTATVSMQQWWAAERAALEARQVAQAKALDASRKAAPANLTPTPDQQRLRHVAPLLRQPWLPVLRVIEHVTEPPVYLLNLGIDPAAGLVRLEGEAASFEQVLAYVQALDDDSVLGPARLGSHELTTDSAGRALVRFSVTTPWRSR